LEEEKRSEMVLKKNQKNRKTPVRSLEGAEEKFRGGKKERGVGGKGSTVCRN